MRGRLIFTDLVRTYPTIALAQWAFPFWEGARRAEEVNECMYRLVIAQGRGSSYSLPLSSRLRRATFPKGEGTFPSEMVGLYRLEVLQKPWVELWLPPGGELCSILLTQ